MKMIKVIAFDLVGVLVTERDIDLTEEENKIERLFGSNRSDADFLLEARKIIRNDALLVRTIQSIIDKIYKVKEPDLFKKLKQKYNNIKIVIATNHVSYIREFIGEAFGIDYLDNFYISAEIHKIKPETTFYEHLLSKLNIKNEELLFLDDSQVNIDGARELGIHTIKVVKEMNLYETIINWLENSN